jgi:hypothetical protein
VGDIDCTASLSGGSSTVGGVVANYPLSSTYFGESLTTSSLSLVIGYPAPVRYSASSKTVFSSRLILDQVDLFLGDGKTRAQDVKIADLQLKLFLGNTQVDWTLTSGVGIPDVRVTSGKVYWTELSAGFYSVRLFPNMLGSWRILLTYPAQDQAVSLAYEVVPQAFSPLGSGMSASFIRR